LVVVDVIGCSVVVVVDVVVAYEAAEKE